MASRATRRCNIMNNSAAVRCKTMLLAHFSQVVHSSAASASAAASAAGRFVSRCLRAENSDGSETTTTATTTMMMTSFRKRGGSNSKSGGGGISARMNVEYVMLGRRFSTTTTRFLPSCSTAAAAAHNRPCSYFRMKERERERG